EGQRSPVGVHDLSDRDAVAPGGAVVGAHLVPSRYERVEPIDPIIQRVEAELRLLLGLLAQLLSQKRECLRQRSPPVLRSGIGGIQAVLPSSHSRTYLAGSLRSTGITPFP